MSRRRSMSTTMGPPPDRDVIMGPPPPPTPSASQQQQQLQQQSQYKQKDVSDVNEKYKRLKRRYFELEDTHKAIHTELQRSGERNVKLKDERDILVDRIIELETQVGILPPSSIKELGDGGPTPPPNAPFQPPTSAFPRALIAQRSRNAFLTNLKQATVEEENEDDHTVDPRLTSRHVGPLAKKREEDERRERVEEEAREAKRASKRARTAQVCGTGQSTGGGAHKGKDISTQSTAQPLLTYALASNQQQQQQTPPQGPSGNTSVLVTNKGTRLRIKPPVPPSDPGPSDGPLGQRGYSDAQQGQQQIRSRSTVSPVDSPADEPGGIVFSHTFANGNGHANLQHHPDPASHPIVAVGSPSSSHLSLSQVVPASSRPSEVQRHAKPKRLKAHTVTSKSFSIPTVPRDKKGYPMLPLNVGIMTVLKLGEVCMREHFHTERYIFPVGYEVTRRYLSTVDPTADVVYHCSILDGGDGPKFQIKASDVDVAVIAGTATGAWSNIVKQANLIRNRQHSNSVSGPDFFGLGQNTIKHLIQELPNANRLRDYVWQNFQEGGPLGGRHAAVIPALPEDYDTGPASQERDPPEGSASPKQLNANSQHSLAHLQPSQNLTTIVLPPPTTSETLNIQEYHPPLAKGNDGSRRGGRRSSLIDQAPQASAKGRNDQQHPAPPPMHSHHTRSHSNARQARGHSQSHTPPDVFVAQPQPQQQQQQSPYLVQPGTDSPRPVPATFASIMNAYPGPSPSMAARSGSSGELSRPGSRDEYSAGGTVLGNEQSV